jgi:hypothetical protein
LPCVVSFIRHTKRNLATSKKFQTKFLFVTQNIPSATILVFQESLSIAYIHRIHDSGTRIGINFTDSKEVFLSHLYATRKSQRSVERRKSHANLHANCHNSIIGHEIADRSSAFTSRLKFPCDLLVSENLPLYRHRRGYHRVVSCPLKVAPGRPPCRTTGISKTHESS